MDKVIGFFIVLVAIAASMGWFVHEPEADICYQNSASRVRYHELEALLDVCPDCKQGEELAKLATQLGECPGRFRP